MTYPPPGWYSDPSDPQDMRWWDGYAWGPMASTMRAAPGQQAAAPAPTGQPGRSALGPVLGALATLAVIGLTSAVIVLATRDNGKSAASGVSATGQQSGQAGALNSASRSPSGSASPSGAPFALHQSCDIDAPGQSYTSTLTNHTGKQLEVDRLTTAFFTDTGAQISTETVNLHQVIKANQRVGISSKVSHKKPPAGSSTCSEIAAKVISDGDDLDVNWPIPH